jgi:hypothetical protein
MFFPEVNKPQSKYVENLNQVRIKQNVKKLFPKMVNIMINDGPFYCFHKGIQKILNPKDVG